MAQVEAQAPPPEAAPGESPAQQQTPQEQARGSGSHVSVASLASQYKAEFEQTLDVLRQRALKLQETAPHLITDVQAEAEPIKQDFLATVQQTGDVGTPASAIVAALAWSTVLVFASQIAICLGSQLATIFSLAIGLYGALAIALVATPLYGQWSIKQDTAAGASDVTIRFRLLLNTLIGGLATGVVLQNSYLSGAPLGAILVGVTASAYPFAVEKFGNNRQMLLGTSIGAAVGVNLVLGLISGFLTLPYLTLTLLYGAVTGVTLQYIYKNITSDTAPTYVYQWGLVVGFNLVYMLTHLTMGMSGDAYNQYKQGQ